MSSPTTPSYDYIVVGGGLAGIVLASRLHSLRPASRILLLEAGPDASGDPRTQDVMGAFVLQSSELDWSYQTTTQSGTNDRIHVCNAGKCLGGGSTINYGHWSRGHRDDYDDWARDPELGQQWGYESLLPYFKKVERCMDPNPDKLQRGTNGPVATVGVTASDPERRYPLREPVRKAWSALGEQFNADANVGRPDGIAEFQENWDNGQRQPANKAYSLAGVEVRTKTLVQRVLLENAGTQARAVGVMLADGTELHSTQEVVICTGAHRTPQLLLLSGIGPQSLLNAHNIPATVPNPSIGQSLFDHFSLFQYYRLREPLAFGSPALHHPAFMKGLPADWQINISVPGTILRPALEADGFTEPEIQAYTQPGRPHLEVLVVYAPAVARYVGLDLPMDGHYMATSTMLLLPTSRGQVSISSPHATDPPVLNPNYFSTHTDRAVLAYGAQQSTRAMLGPEMAAYIETEIPPPGTQPLTPDSSPEAFIDRVEKVGVCHAHAAGSCALGRAVDGDLRVKGVKGLRVCDASVFPKPVGGHPQASLYAVAERAADLVVADRQGEKGEGAGGKSG